MEHTSFTIINNAFCIDGDYFTVSNGNATRFIGRVALPVSDVLAAECVVRGSLFSKRRYVELTTMRGTYRIAIPKDNTSMEYVVQQFHQGTYQCSEQSGYPPFVFRQREVAEQFPSIQANAPFAPVSPPQSREAYDVFVSHSSKDKAVADAIVNYVESRNVRCWVAPRDINPSMEWAESIVNGIKASRVFLLIFCNNSLQSKQVQREVNQAINANLPLLPFRIENVMPQGSFSYYLDTIHWLDAYDGKWEVNFDKLYRAVATLL